MNHLMPVYASLNISFKRGEGVWLWDEKDNRYLDALAGIAVNCLGHRHPNIIKAFQEQLNKVIHVSNVVTIPEQIELANYIAKISGLSQSFFCNSGAEANEAAIKIARMYATKNNITDARVIATTKAFHGRTMATLSASGSDKVKQGFEPLVQGFLHIPYNDIAAIHEMQHKDKIVAVLIEPIQGEGGVVVPDKNYLQQLRQLCDENNWLLILDEVQTGVGRTGKMFAYQHYDILPDVVTLAKGLGGGIPIGACVVGKKLENIFTFGNHGSTFGGNPLSSKIAFTVLETIVNENILQNVLKQSQALREKLTQSLVNMPMVKDIRGQGLMLGIELDRPCRDILNIGLKNNILFSVTSQKVIRLVPPLVINNEEIDFLVKQLTKTIQEYQEINL